MQVFGKVQGVAFRYYTREKAVSLGIKGFVKNMRDGSVYIEACGEQDGMKRFIEWCRHGPAMARVTHVEIQEKEEHVRADTFTVR